MQLEDLVKKTIKNLYITPDNTCLKFETENEDIFYFTEGDCCSQSWINHISGIDAIKGQKVHRVDEIEMGEDPNDDTDELVQIYSYKIFTAQGVCELEMRNASNGYYGGSIEKCSGTGITDFKPVLEDF